MRKKSLIVSRRDVVAGIGGLAVMAAARPVMAQAPSGTPIRIGQTLSLTGPFAQTGLIHKIVSEYYVDRLNKNGGLLGRPSSTCSTTISRSPMSHARSMKSC